MTKVLIPLPNRDFDPSEAAIPFCYFKEKGYHITFATPEGKVPAADPIMLTGKSLGLLKGPLMARADARDCYQKMIATDEFQQPVTYESLQSQNFDVLLLPGGHAKGIREYLESQKIQSICSDFMQENKVVGAICHGVLVPTRSVKADGSPVLKGRTTTGLLRKQELLAYNLTRMWLGDYYLTYPETTVEDEVYTKLESKEHFIQGPMPLFRDTEQNLNPGFCHVDNNYVSARWPGDVYNFTFKLIEKIEFISK